MEPEQDSNQSKIMIIAQFLYVWLCIAFPLGLLTLTVGPMRWFANYAHRISMPADKEALYGKLIIVGYIVVTIVIAILISRALLKSGSKKRKNGGIGALTVLLIISVGIFVFNPKLLIAKQANEHIEADNNNRLEKAQFILGAYPDYNQLKILKTEGYSAVISLLHPLVVPAEPKLLNEERLNAKDAGVELIEIPMLPWISGNEEAIKKIRELARRAKGKYYVHCYLGKDRVNAFRSIIMDENAAYQASKEFDARTLKGIKIFERGPIIDVGNQIYLTPYPTDEEFMGYIFNGDIKTIVNTLDPSKSSYKELIAKEEKYAKQYGVTFVNLPVKGNSTSTISAFVSKVSQLKKPMVIHGYDSNDPTTAGIKEALTKMK